MSQPKLRKYRYKLDSDIEIGEHYRIDDGAIVGYSPIHEGINLPTCIGKNLVIYSGSIIYKGVRLGNSAMIGHNAIIREKNVIGDNFKLWNNSVVDYGCTIGSNVKIHCNCYIAQNTIIEDNVFIAPGVMIGNDFHPGCDFSKDCMQKTSVIIREGAQIGLNVTILPGVSIGQKALVGGGSVVTEDIPAEMVAIGNPARVVKTVYDLNCKTALTHKPYNRK